MPQLRTPLCDLAMIDQQDLVGMFHGLRCGGLSGFLGNKVLYA